MKILFLGTHGQYNIGDELLLETFLSQLGSENRFVVNSYDPAFTRQMLQAQYDITTFHTTRQLPFFLRSLLSSDLIFFGGGSIIKELYASVGRNPYATLRMILASVTTAKQIARKKVVMSNIGVGPIATPNGERLARWILSQVDFVSVRDQRSLEICQRLGIPAGKVRRVPDAVFANPPSVFLPNPPAPASSPRLRVALNLNYDIENREAWEGFLASLAEALALWNQRQPLEIHALPMQSKFKANDDLAVLKAFSERLPGIEMVLHDPQTAGQAGEIMASCQVVLAERLHTLVIASILGRPFFGLTYDVKVRELVDYLGMAEYAIDINQPFQAQTLLAGITRLMENQQAVSDHLLARSAALRGELQAYFAELRAGYTQPKPGRQP